MVAYLIAVGELDPGAGPDHQDAWHEDLAALIHDRNSALPSLHLAMPR